MYPSPVYARDGLVTRRQKGEPPADALALAEWLPDALGIDVVIETVMPPGIYGVAVPFAGEGDYRGRVLLAHDTPCPRWVLAHEVGHLMTGATAPLAYSYRPHAPNVACAERAANEWAACWLLDMGALIARYREGWTMERASADAGVPVPVVALRAELSRLLGEFDGKRYRSLQDTLCETVCGWFRGIDAGEGA